MFFAVTRIVFDWIQEASFFDGTYTLTYYVQRLLWLVIRGKEFSGVLRTREEQPWWLLAYSAIWCIWLPILPYLLITWIAWTRWLTVAMSTWDDDHTTPPGSHDGHSPETKSGLKHTASGLPKATYNLSQSYVASFVLYFFLHDWPMHLTTYGIAGRGLCRGLLNLALLVCLMPLHLRMTRTMLRRDRAIPQPGTSSRTYLRMLKLLIPTLLLGLAQTVTDWMWLVVGSPYLIHVHGITPEAHGTVLKVDGPKLLLTLLFCLMLQLTASTLLIRAEIMLMKEEQDQGLNGLDSDSQSAQTQLKASYLLTRQAVQTLSIKDILRITRSLTLWLCLTAMLVMSNQRGRAMVKGESVKVTYMYW